jgi:hypothetical protein
MPNPKIARNARTAVKTAPSVAGHPKRASKTPRSSAAPSNGNAAPTPATPKAKHKLVRDSFTIPRAEYAVLEALKERAANLKRPTKKSELLRAGVVALRAMTDQAFLTVLDRVPSLKTGRPKGTEA